MTSMWPCPCCGHLTLRDGPGAYELCPVCFWEDDCTQLRWPMSSDGANGISLVEAQQTYRRDGTMDGAFRRKVRRPLAGEPVDPGWRPFEPDVDWTHPELPGERWPANIEALYYWRPTYWNGDPHRTPAPPRELTGDDRLVQHLLSEVPEIESVVDAVLWKYGEAVPMAVCGRTAAVAIGACRDGDDELGLRIARALNPGLNETSDLYAPQCVSIGFLENDGRHDDALRPFFDQWPDDLRAEIRKQLAHVAWWRARTNRGTHSDLQRALTARVLSDHRWGYKHPLAAVAIAWQYRRVQSPLRTLNGCVGRASQVEQSPT